MASDVAIVSAPLTISPQTNNRPNLLGVPPEIRLMIYGELWRDIPIQRPGQGPRNDSAILFTCRSIRSEAMHRWYSTATFAHIINSQGDLGGKRKMAFKWLRWLNRQRGRLPLSLRKMDLQFIDDRVRGSAYTYADGQPCFLPPGMVPAYRLEIDLSVAPPAVAFTYRDTVGPLQRREMVVLKWVRDLIACNGIRRPHEQTALSADSWAAIFLYLRGRNES